MRKYICLVAFIALAGFISSCGKNKQEIITGTWKLNEAEFAGNKLTSDQLSATYVFKEDGTFEITEEGKTEDGNWAYYEDKNILTLAFNDEERKLDMKVNELSEEKMKMSWEEFTMKFSATLVPAK